MDFHEPSFYVQPIKFALSAVSPDMYKVIYGIKRFFLVLYTF